MTLTVRGHPIDVPDGRRFVDFYLRGRDAFVDQLDVVGLLRKVDAGEIPLEAFEALTKYLARWTVDAPRKREYRRMRKAGMIVVSTEHFFEDATDDAAERLLADLEATGRLFQAVRDAFGWKGGFWDDRVATGAPTNVNL